MSVRAALTGASGFVGRHVAEALREAGHDVACLVRAPAAEPTLRTLGCHVVRGDLADETALRALVEGADVVLHVAGAIAAPSEAAFLATNRDGTARVAAAARQGGAGRLLYLSSLAVTGPTTPGHPLDESSPPRPITAYGRSKLAGEEAVRAAGVPFTILRPPVVYGPHDRQLLRAFRLAHRGLGPLLGDGTQELSLVHARDLARAVLAAATAEATAGRTYHAGHETPATQRALMAAIGEAVDARVRLVRLAPVVVHAALHLSGLGARLRGGASLLEPGKAAELLAPAWTCSSAALLRDAGWRAAIDLDSGLAETARWYRGAGWL